MRKNYEFGIKVGEILRSIGSNKAIAAAERLENSPLQYNQLHLRDLELTSADANVIAHLLKFLPANDHDSLRSITFSNNSMLGNEGVITLVNAFPPSIREIGLVNCGIGDEGGKEVLKFVKNTPNLTMICIEQNHFSEGLRNDFLKFSDDHPHILVVI